MKSVLILMNKSTIALAVLLLLSVSLVMFGSFEERHGAFEEWKAKYGAKWPKEQEVYRRIIFENKLKEISRHNSNPLRTYDKAINQFSALTASEFQAKVLMKTSVEHLRVTAPQSHKNYTVPNGEVDWVRQGKVSPVKDQGQCGACWAFTAVAMAESYSLQDFPYKQRILSEQQLVDCTYGTTGCNGGYIEDGVKYISRNGVQTDFLYPYVARKEDCHYAGGGYRVDGFRTASPGCDQLANYLQFSPLGVNVNSQNWQDYGAGVFADCKDRADHAVLLVGVSDLYWKVKNSWGTGWGEGGYMRLLKGNTCGICSYTFNLLKPS